ncbi:MAG: hypothetical protein ACYSX0_02710 [Planctomycetota bacterium]|jgi:hypothetical protein
MDKDLLGNPAGEIEKEVARVYADLRSLATRTDAPPCVVRNAKKALACLWQAANDLDLEVPLDSSETA